MKQTIVQYFQWYTRADGFQYTRLAKAAPRLARLGVTMVWMPPAYKGQAGRKDVGYGAYDLYDIGEFRQKGTVSTKYGSLRQYQHAINTLHSYQIGIAADIVFNHRMGGDETEMVKVRRVNPENRMEFLGEPFETPLYTRFTFPGRKGAYSSFTWNSTCFKGTDMKEKRGSSIVLFDGKHWDQNVSKECGNFDYIMGMDVDTSAPWVKKELTDWGIWYTRRFGIDGYRLDAIKSIDAGFFPDWLAAMRSQAGAGPFAVGEYWSPNLNELLGYLDQCHHCMRLFDVPLHYRLHNISRSQGKGDVRHLLQGTLSEAAPDYAAAFVDNHDTQPGQALESWVEDWFKTSAYALVLLSVCQTPFVFLGDLEGIKKSGNPKTALLEEMIWIRSHLLEGTYFDLCDEDPQKACWMMYNNVHPILVLFTIEDAKSRFVDLPALGGCRFQDISRPEVIVELDAWGKGTFTCAPGCCSIYLLEHDFQTMKTELKSRIRKKLF